jgi:hypothetical protein
MVRAHVLVIGSVSNVMNPVQVNGSIGMVSRVLTVPANKATLCGVTRPMVTVFVKPDG